MPIRTAAETRETAAREAKVDRYVSTLTASWRVAPLEGYANVSEFAEALTEAGWLVIATQLGQAKHPPSDKTRKRILERLAESCATEPTVDQLADRLLRSIRGV